jgi:hypothetical protein
MVVKDGGTLILLIPAPEGIAGVVTIDVAR